MRHVHVLSGVILTVVFPAGMEFGWVLATVMCFDVLVNACKFFQIHQSKSFLKAVVHLSIMIVPLDFTITHACFPCEAASSETFLNWLQVNFFPGTCKSDDRT